MAIIYKIDILETLKSAGYTSYKLRKDKLLGELTIQNLRNKKMVSFANIDTICRLLSCQPGDLLEYIPDKSPQD